MLYAQIAIPSPLTETFTYEVPATMQNSVFIGQRVFVPFGKTRKVMGFLVGLTEEKPNFSTKEILDLLDLKPIFTDEMLKLANWISKYYFSSPGEVLKAFLPQGIFLNSEKIILKTEQTNFETLTDLEKSLLEKLPQNYENLEKYFDSPNYLINKLEQKGFVKIDYSLKETVSAKFENFAKLKIDGETLQKEIEIRSLKFPKQAKMLQCLLETGEAMKVSTLLNVSETSYSQLKTLERNGLIEVFEQEVQRNVFSGIVQKELSQLNFEQEIVCEKIDFAVTSGKFKAFLLYGITGSGKTRVYINALKKVVEAGKTGIVLVPEISLTPQTVRRFKEAFGEEIAVLHSKMSIGERFDSWRAIQNQKIKIVVGARSAVFAPLSNLGMIIIDEEHEFTYKQFDTNPRYQARDVAIYRAFLNKAIAILGSATPSVESFFNAKNGKYDLLKIRNRAVQDSKLPKTEIVNLIAEKNSLAQWSIPIFSESLISSINQTLQKNEQIILLQNKRGFSTMLHCKSAKCGFVAKCENCDVSLVFHQSEKILKCHYCDFTQKPPELCPLCGDATLRQGGIGTQKVEHFLASLFPNTSIVRMDVDTTKTKDAHQKILDAFSDGTYQILLGTQMVAKGLDFPRVTLVGVVSADTGLLLPDFRAGERSFQLLSQVSGRSGRGNDAGKVIIQTSFPENPIIDFVKNHDYEGFYELEIKIRKTALYPPFCRLVMILFRGENEAKVKEMAKIFAEKLPEKDFLIFLGPTEASISKIKNNFRYQILLKINKEQDSQNSLTNQILKGILLELKNKLLQTKVSVTIDVDPYGML
ncbi:primosomal protein N' [bacterium]|nr:primosomal protein N' [bacterium]